MLRLRAGLLGGLVLLAALPTPAFSSAPTQQDYERLAAHRLGVSLALPSGGVEWQIDVARFVLESGSWRLQEPVLGVTPGLWFEGRGRIEVAIPDAVERRQLRRLLADPDLEALSLDFDRLVLRASGGPPASQLPAAGPVVGTEAAFEARHERYLTIRRFDADARVLAALGQPGALYWQADMRTTEHDWVTLIYDSQEPEEIRVEWFDSGHDFLESWVSLDRAADRTPAGRPTSRPNPPLDIEHLDIRADLTAAARRVSSSIDGRFLARVELTTRADGLSVLPLTLYSRAEVTSVVDADGAALDFVRDHIGGRTGALDKEIYDHSLLVLLPGPQPAGSRLVVEIAYELRVPKYAGGRSWYPGGRDSGGLHDLHTARLELTTDDRHDLEAMGRLVEERLEGHRKVTVWEVSEPVKMITFAMQKGRYEKLVERPGLPPLTTVGGLGDRVSGLNEERIDQVAVITAGALDYFQQVFDRPLPGDHLYAALIPSRHGQAFAGFLHLGEFTATLDTPAASERFRAHEAAHQWWGHLVGWNSYRDQWLSEGFAEYSALMFVHDAVDNGPAIFEEAITAYSNEVRGSIKTAFSKWSRFDSALLTARGAERVGPIGQGWRAAIGETPTAYQTLVYSKGALVLHMLRGMTRQMTGSDDAFIGILRDFVDAQAGRAASTEDFRAAVERQVPADWSWFFDQWIYGAEIPTYSWEYDVVPRPGGGSTLRLTVEQRGVSAGFKMLVPVEVRFTKGQVGTLAVFVDEPLETFELELPARPRSVTFNPRDAVLASVKKR